MRNLAFAQDNLFLRGVLQGDSSLLRDGADYCLTHRELVWRPMTKVVGPASGEAGSIVYQGRLGIPLRSSGEFIHGGLYENQVIRSSKP